eukprot:GHRQ01034922.1.p1 GENE.GHRQ01034922.1~~GHRQ01034922.1.p1  ORF type:complete len:195 (+),score=40.56 GHRQ01034922.1:253-837(+)
MQCMSCRWAARRQSPEVGSQHCNPAAACNFNSPQPPFTFWALPSCSPAAGHTLHVDDARQGALHAVAAVQSSFVLQVACGVAHAGAEVMELQEFYEHMEQHRAATVDSAVQRYRSLTPLLGKVCGSSSQATVLTQTWLLALDHARTTFTAAMLCHKQEVQLVLLNSACVLHRSMGRFAGGAVLQVHLLLTVHCC